MLSMAVQGDLPKGAVLREAMPGQEAGWAEEMAEVLRSAGYETRFIGVQDLIASPPGLADSLILIAGARTLPAEAAQGLEHHFRKGGEAIVLGLPAGAAPNFLWKGQWRGRADYVRILREQRPAAYLYDFEREELKGWVRHGNDTGIPTRIEIQAEDQNRVLHVTAPRLTGWDTLGSPEIGMRLPTNGLTCFRAKGGAQTRQLALEWTEGDGSRWIATVNLKPDWQRYVLPVEAFKAWAPPPGRGGTEDKLRLENAIRFTPGLALTHTAPAAGLQEYWLDEVGVTAHPMAAQTDPPRPYGSRLESLAPVWMFHPIHGPVQLRAVTTLGWAIQDQKNGLTSGKEEQEMSIEWSGREGKPQLPLLAMHPRPRAPGFLQHRAWRWQPLIEAWAGQEKRGAIAALVAHAGKPYPGAAWAAFTPEDPAFYRQEPVRRLLRQVAAQMRQGVCLMEGGSEFFTVLEGQKFQLGGRLACFGLADKSNLTVRVAVTRQGDKELLWRQEWPVRIQPGQEQTVQSQWKPGAWPRQGMTVATELWGQEGLLDRLEHELQVWRPSSHPAYITARNGQLWLEGRPWKAHGVNYMPSSGIGLDGTYFEHWLGRGAYDPEVIERDLGRIRSMDMNSVSVFIYYQSLGAQHLLDFLRRCQRHGLRVNQSLRPGTPMEFRWSEMKALIEHYRLAENDTIFAYDLAWEPSHYDHRYERGYQAAWKEWGLKRHGSLEKARQAWRFSEANFEDVPKSEWLIQDGPWRGVVIEYRTFLDEWVGKKYAEARALVRSVDPHHLVSFRMQMAGDPTHNQAGLMPYDFRGLSEAVDLWEPEAYGRIGDWERIKPGRFTADYARLCDPAKPVIWSEMGVSVWDMNRMAPDAAKLEFAGQYYTDFYRMMRESGAQGVFFWWYPGGYRLNENSDYGIINADGTDRPVTQVIRKEGERFMEAPMIADPDTWIEIDPEQDARGLYGIYERVKERYWEAIAKGQNPGLRWKKREASEK